MIVIASDHAGIDLKARVLEVVRGEGHEVLDLGPMDSSSVDYPDFGHKVAAAVVAGEAQTGILICGTGIGMAMTANRHPGIPPKWRVATMTPTCCASAHGPPGRELPSKWCGSSSRPHSRAAAISAGSN